MYKYDSYIEAAFVLALSSAKIVLAKVPNLGRVQV